MFRKIMGIVLLGSAASQGHAAIFDFTCGPVEFTLDIEAGTMSDRFNGTQAVTWQYDGTWLLWKASQKEEWSGVNVTDGTFLMNGVPDPNAMCWMPNKETADKLLSKN